MIIWLWDFRFLSHHVHNSKTLWFSNSDIVWIIYQYISSSHPRSPPEMVRWHHWLSGHDFEPTPEDSEGQGSLACCSPWGHKELDMTKNRTTTSTHIFFSETSFPGTMSGARGMVEQRWCLFLPSSASWAPGDTGKHIGIYDPQWIVIQVDKNCGWGWERRHQPSLLGRGVSRNSFPQELGKEKEYSTREREC